MSMLAVASSIKTIVNWFQTNISPKGMKKKSVKIPKKYPNPVPIDFYLL